MNEVEIAQTRDGIRLISYASFHWGNKVDFASCRISLHSGLSTMSLSDRLLRNNIWAPLLWGPWKPRFAPYLSTQDTERRGYWNGSSGLPRRGKGAVKGSKPLDRWQVHLAMLKTYPRHPRTGAPMLLRAETKNRQRQKQVHSGWLGYQLWWIT